MNDKSNAADVDRMEAEADALDLIQEVQEDNMYEHEKLHERFRAIGQRHVRLWNVTVDPDAAHDAVLREVHEQRDPELWNVAADLVVNSVLKESQVTLPVDLLMPADFGFVEGLDIRQYYDQLMELRKLWAKCR